MKKKRLNFIDKPNLQKGGGNFHTSSVGYKKFIHLVMGLVKL